GEERAQAQRSLAETYRLVAGALRKLGDRGLSAIAADRSMQAAQAGGDPLDVASSARCLCIALFETGHHGRAIELATAAAGDLAGLPVAERRAHHLLDVALGHGHLGRWDQALATLLQAERIGPDEVRLDAAARGLVADLLRRARRSSAELRGLGGRVGLP